MMTTHDTSLTDLLPKTSYRLCYALPLLFVSLFVTISGTFFTLDRTRSFASSYHSIPGSFKEPKSKLKYLLQGGVGGLGIGYLFGIHFSTLFALLIPAKTSSSPLTPGSFIAVWLLSALVTTILAGRWRWAALTLAGLSGGAALSMAVLVIIHPSLLTRIVLLAVFTALLTVVTLLPFTRTQHIFLRLATTSLGAFGVILSVSILASIPEWADVWKRLWVDDDVAWGSSQEKGLSAGFYLFQVFGALCDFFLHWKFGECPDKLWDEYLAKYTTNLPDRTGSFRPFVSVWDRIFGRVPPENQPDDSTLEKDIMFPPDIEPRMPTSPSQKAIYQPSYEFSAAHLKKSRSNANRMTGLKSRREGVKFKPSDKALSSDSEDELDNKPPPRPWMLRESNSTTTLIEENVDADKEYVKLNKPKEGFFIMNGAPEYSDYEEDLASINVKRQEKEASTREDKAWSPGFLQRHASSQTSSARSSSQATTAVDPNALMPIPVPATPSLIKALDRIAIAQKDAFGKAPPRPGLPHTQSSNVGLHEGLPTTVKQQIPKPPEGPKWNEFWRDVDDKVRESR